MYSYIFRNSHLWTHIHDLHQEEIYLEGCDQPFYSRHLSFVRSTFGDNKMQRESRLLSLHKTHSSPFLGEARIPSPFHLLRQPHPLLREIRTLPHVFHMWHWCVSLYALEFHMSMVVLCVRGCVSVYVCSCQCAGGGIRVQTPIIEMGHPRFCVMAGEVEVCESQQRILGSGTPNKETVATILSSTEFPGTLVQHQTVTSLGSASKSVSTLSLVAWGGPSDPIPFPTSVTPTP